MNGKQSISAGDVTDSVLVTGSQNVIIQAGQVLFQAAQRAAHLAAHVPRVHAQALP